MFLTLLVISLRVFSDALQAKLLHDTSDSLFPHMNATFGKDDPNLFCPETLLAVIKNLLYLQHELSLFFLILTPVRPAKNVVIKCSPGYIQSFTELIDIVFLVLDV